MARIPADVRRGLLLEAALEVMAEGGVAAGTTRAIAGRADMPVAAFHYCFRSRDEMIRELIQKLSSIEREAVLDQLDGTMELPVALQAAGDAFLGHIETNPGHELVLLELHHYALRTPGLEELAEQQYEAYFANARMVLVAIAQATGTRWSLELDVLCRMVVTLLDGITTTWLADRDTAATRTVLDHYLQQIGTLARPVA